MKKAIYAVIAAALLGIPLQVLAQFSVERPELRAGDTWTYVEKGGLTPGMYRAEVLAREPDGYRVSSTNEATGKAVSYLRTFDLNRVDVVNGESHPRGWLKFPLSPSKTWEAKEMWPNGGGYLLLTYTVAGMEKMTVPAGTFDSIKIAGKGRWFNTSTNGSDVATVTVWYVPALRGLARYNDERWVRGSIDLNITDELASYRLVDEQRVPQRTLP